MKIKRLVHPLYSLDLSPCDFWFVGQAKTALRDQRFADGDALVEGLTNLCDGFTFEELQSVSRPGLTDWNGSLNAISHRT
jgi:hypothetical protein